MVRENRGSGRAVLVDGLPLSYAQGRAEDEVRTLGAAVLADRGAAWRRQPATDKQLAALRRRGQPTRAGLTRGEASDLIAAAVARRTA